MRPDQGDWPAASVVAALFGTRAAARGVAVRHSCAAAGRHENEVC
jgi:hypothetical protein